MVHPLSKINTFFSYFHTNFDWEKTSFPLLLTISVVAIFFQLGSRSFENQCYIRYAEVAREMIRSGDWIVPRLEGELFLHKPVLIIWLIALPSALLGNVTPFVARLPSALSALAVIGLTYYLGKKMFRDFRVGAIAGLILLSSKEFFWQARTARGDMVITLFILFSLICFYWGYESAGKKRCFLFVLFFVGMALGALTKGPVVILFYLGPIAVFLFLKKRLRVLLEPGFWWGWVVFLLFLLSWIVPYLSRVKISTVMEHFALSEILSRPEPFYYYLVEFWPRFAPWSLFLPAAVLFFLRKNSDQRDARLFLLSWLGVIIVLIFPIQNKTYRYFLPIFPAYVIILGAAFKEGFLSPVANKQDWMTRFWRYPSLFYLVVFLIAFLPAPFFAWWFTRELTPVVVSMLVGFLGILLIVYTIRRGKDLAKLVVMSLVTLIIFETYYYFISREDKKHSPVMQMAKAIHSRIEPDKLCLFDLRGDSTIFINFYLDTVIPKFNNPSEVKTFFNQPRKLRACLTSEKGLNQIFKDLPPQKIDILPMNVSKKATYFLVINKKG